MDSIILMPLNYFQLTIRPTILGKRGYAGLFGTIMLLPLKNYLTNALR